MLNVPLRNPIFAGRDTELASVTLGFQRSPLLLLHGPGGWGKTQIALEYCYRWSASYTTILWLSASSRALLGRDVSALADRLSLPNDTRENELHLFASLKQWLQDRSGWLLVLDHLDDLSLIDLIIPPELEGHLLVTTTLDPIGSSPSSPVPPNLSEQTLLLLQQAGFIVVQETSEPPLSQTIQTLTVKTIGSSLTDALSRFQQQQAAFSKENAREYAAFQQEEVRQLFLAFSHSLPAPLLDVLRLLTFFQPEAVPQELLQAVDSEELPEPLSSLIAHPQALEDLESEELLSLGEERMLHLHPGLKTVLVESLTNDEQRAWASLAVQIVNHAFPVVRFDTWDDCQRSLPLAQQCASLITNYQLALKEGALLLERLGTYCSRRASYSEAETYLTQALELYEHHLHTDTLDAAQTMNSLGLLYSEQARYKEAEALHRRALEVRERVLGSDSPKTAVSLHNLAVVYGDMGQYQRAEEIYLRILPLEEQSKGPDHPDLADTLNNLGLTYYYQGRHGEAETTYHRVLTIYKHSLPADHPDWAYPLDGLGTLAERRGDYHRAEEFYQQAFDICRLAFGVGHPETAHSINRLADIALSQGNDQQAKERYEQALAILEQVRGPEHPEVALVLNNLAFLATKQGHYAQAEPLYQRALSIYEQAPGTEHPDVASVLNNLGQLSRKTGNVERAEKLLRRALAICEQALGKTHPDTAQSLMNLANLLSDEHRDQEAAPFLQQARIISLLRASASEKEKNLLDVLRLMTFFSPQAIPQEVLLKAASAELSELLSSLLADPAVLEQTLSDLETEKLLRLEEDRMLHLHLHSGVEELLVASLPDDERQHWAGLAVRLVNYAFPDETHFDTWEQCERLQPLAERCAVLLTTYHPTLPEGALLLERLGSYQRERGLLVQAEMALTQALDLQEQSAEADPLDVAQTLNSLGRLFSQQARYHDAQLQYQRALALQEQTLGHDDPRTADSLHNLAALYEHQGQYKQAEDLYRKALAIDEQGEDQDGDSETGTTINNIGLMQYLQGHYAEAETTYHRALTVYELTLSPEHPDLAYPLNGLGAIAEKQGQYEQAEQFYRRALHIREQGLGPEHSETAHSLKNVASILERRGENQHAEELYQKALAISEHALGPEHPDVALFLNNLAFLASKQGQYQQAEPLYQRALNIYEQVLGPDHPTVAHVLNNLGQLSQKTGDKERAEVLLRRALAIYEQALGAAHPDTAQGLRNLADVLSDEEAEPLLQRALAIYLQALGPRRAQVGSVQETLAALQMRRNHNKEDVE